jgi:predicted outer membrane repeat protein
LNKTLAIFFLLSALPIASSQAAVYRVTSTADNVDAVVTSGHAGTLADPYLAPSLRSAIVAANAASGSNTIVFATNLNGSPITLTIAGLDDTGLKGDLDVTSALTVQGNGPANTIIQAGGIPNGGIDKVFSFNPMGTLNGFAVTLSGVTIRNGRNADSGTTGNQEGGAFDFHSGPNHSGFLLVTNCVITGNATINGDGGAVALFDGGTFTFTNSVITNNTSSSTGAATADGGAIFIKCTNASASLTIAGCMISGNTASGTTARGGGIFLSGQCSATLNYAIRNSTISGNHAAGDGGGIWSAAPLTIDSGGGPTLISGNSSGGNGGGLWLNGASTLSQMTVTGNSATGNGGGIHSDSSIATLGISYCRIEGNTSATALGLAATGGSVTAQNNWWATNNSPAPLISGTVNFTPWLMLRAFANPSTLPFNGQSTLTATFLTNSTGSFVAASNLGRLIGLPVSFSNPVKGSLSGAQSSIQSSGTATATFTAGTVTGPGGADATVDNVTATAPLSVVCPTVTAAVSGGGTICSGGSTNVLVNVSGGTPPYQLTLSNGGGTQTNNGPGLLFTLSPTSTTSYAVVSGADNVGCPISGVGSATITVNPVPAPTVYLGPTIVCPGSSGNLAATPVGPTSYAWSIVNGTITSATNVPSIVYTAGASGNVTLLLSVTNSTGCFASISTNVPILVDTNPPGIICSTDLVVSTFGDCPAIVNFSITATDNCAVVNLAVNPPSGSAFPVGTNTVKATAYDFAGNSNTCSFKVIVLPGSAPQLNIVRAGTNVVLSWSNVFGCYALQTVGTLRPPPATNTWTNFSGVLATNGGYIYATNDTSLGSRFYRLRF